MRNTVIFEDAELLFRNFSGTENDYNQKGRRNFCVKLDEEKARQFMDEGWTVKPLKKKDPDDETFYKIKINVNFDSDYPPEIYMIRHKGGKMIKGHPLPASAVGQFDHAEIIKCDLVVSPYHNKKDPNHTTGYLKTAYITVREDPFAEMYADDCDDCDDEIPFE